MKNNFKSRFKEGCGDAVAEIVLSLLFLGIGAAVLAVFGVGGDAEWLDDDLMILIGIGAVLIPGAIIFAIIRAVKKRKKEKIKKLELYKHDED